MPHGLPGTVAPPWAHREWAASTGAHCPVLWRAAVLAELSRLHGGAQTQSSCVGYFSCPNPVAACLQRSKSQWRWVTGGWNGRSLAGLLFPYLQPHHQWLQRKGCKFPARGSGNNTANSFSSGWFSCGEAGHALSASHITIASCNYVGLCKRPRFGLVSCALCPVTPTGSFFMDVIDLNVCSRAPLELGYFSCWLFPRVVRNTKANIKLLAGFLPF